jgi:DNA-binding CsgD family transcriptional regulator
MARDISEYSEFDQLAQAMVNGTIAVPLYARRSIASVVVVDGRPYRIAAVHSSESRARTVSVVVITPIDESANDDPSDDSDTRLTPRERQIADLLAHRRTNEEIAVILGISPHTARNHVQQILGKLGVSSRRDVGAMLGRGSHV